MFDLDIEYFSYICKKSLTISGKLQNLYNQSCRFDSAEDGYRVLFPHRHLNFLIKMLDLADTGGESNQLVDDYLTGYDQLSGLIGYMHNVENQYDEYRELKRGNPCYPKLYECQLEDSRLVSMILDSGRHICQFRLKNVLLYGEKRVNRNSPVDCGEIILSFQEVNDLEIKGQIDMLIPDANLVYKWCITQLRKETPRFCFLILNGNKQFMIQFLYKDVDIIPA